MRQSKQKLEDYETLLNIVEWLFEYVEEDEILSDGDENMYSFPNVVMSINEKEKKNIERIINKKIA